MNKKNTSPVSRLSGHYCPHTGQPIQQAARMQRCGICDPALGIYPTDCQRSPVKAYKRAVHI